MTITGVVFDTYLLNQEKWVKILQLSDPKREDTKLEKNIVYKLPASDELTKELKVNELAGGLRPQGLARELRAWRSRQ